MTHVYVLTYFGEKRPEYWFRTKAEEIIDCIQDFMEYDEDDDSLNFGISLNKLDSDEVVYLDRDLGLDTIDKDIPFTDVKKICEKFIGEVSQKYDKLCEEDIEMKALRENLEMRVCENCSIFTYKQKCPKCEGETESTEI